MADRDPKGAVPSAPFSYSLFRPEAFEEPELGAPFGFAIPSWRALGLLALALILCLLGFSILEDFYRVSTVRGIMVPPSGVARVAAPKPGVIAALFAREGDRIEEGKPLFAIASPGRLSNGVQIAAAQLKSYQRQQRLVEQEQQQQQQKRGAERAQILADIAQLTATSASLAQQLEIQRERIVTNADRLRKLGELKAKGYVSDATYLAQQEAVLSLRQQLAGLGRQQTQAGEALIQAHDRLMESAVNTRLAMLQRDASLQELARGAAAAEAESGTIVAAPLPGRIAMLRVARGDSVKAEEELAAIVPEGDKLEALLFLPPTAIGSVQPGLSVALRFDAFPYQRYGVGRGVVHAIASAGAPQAGSPERVYRAYVTIIDMPPGVRPRMLRPDMTLSAAIRLERRSLLDWFLAPLRQKWREAQAREAEEG
jgi:membrane fusion protein